MKPVAYSVLICSNKLKIKLFESLCAGSWIPYLKIRFKMREKVASRELFFCGRYFLNYFLIALFQWIC